MASALIDRSDMKDKDCGTVFLGDGGSEYSSACFPGPHSSTRKAMNLAGQVHRVRRNSERKGGCGGQRGPNPGRQIHSFGDTPTRAQCENSRRYWPMTRKARQRGLTGLFAPETVRFGRVVNQTILRPNLF
jgi:hypothetical protein